MIPCNCTTITQDQKWFPLENHGDDFGKKCLKSVTNVGIVPTCPHIYPWVFFITHIIYKQVQCFISISYLLLKYEDPP